MKILLASAFVFLGFLLYRSFAMASPLPQVGQAAPPFSLTGIKGDAHRLQDYQGSWLVLYFYPKDDTPGCTKEACSFRDDMVQLEKLGAKIVGISVDDTESHAKFAKKYNLPFPLLSDTDGKVAASYGALTNLGIIKIAKRYTFLINPEGQIAKVYQSVDTSRHSQEIIDDLRQLSAR